VAAALVSGLGVALVAHAVTVLVFFVVNGSATANLVPISNFFLPASLVLFVLASVAASLGANRSWWTAVLSGLLTGALAASFGTGFGIVSTGTPWNKDVADFVIASLIGNNLIFVVAATVASLAVGRRLWLLIARSPASGAQIALVRQPSSSLNEGELTYRERVDIDLERADEQWDLYVEALEANGFEVVEVPAADELPDSVFLEDALVVVGDTAIVTSPGAESRRPETDAVAPVAKSLGLTVRSIDLPGTLDGGDVLVAGSTAYVGRSTRTNAEGIRQLRAIVGPLGYSVVTVPVKKALHLKSVVTALPDGTVIGAAKAIENPQVFTRFLALPEASGTAVVVLSSDSVLMAASAPRSAALIADLGYRVVTVDLSEFEKAEGGVTCLSVLVH
jgi:dimethylargininase